MNKVSYNACPCLLQKPLCSDDMLRVCGELTWAIAGWNEGTASAGWSPCFHRNGKQFLKILFQCQRLNNILLKKSLIAHWNFHFYYLFCSYNSNVSNSHVLTVFQQCWQILWNIAGIHPTLKRHIYSTLYFCDLHVGMLIIESWNGLGWKVP